MVFVSGPVLLIGLQLLNAWFFAAVAGIGLTLFQRPGHRAVVGRCESGQTDDTTGWRSYRVDVRNA